MCDCVERVQETIDKQYPGYTLDKFFFTDGTPPRPRLPLIRPKRSSEKSLVPAYCPFCGQQYEDAK